MLFMSLALLGDSVAPATEAEKWVGPVLTSVASLAATLFASLTARDQVRYNADSKIREAELATIKEAHEECERDHKRLWRKFVRLGKNVQALSLGKPMPYPDEMGFPDEDDSEMPDEK